MNQPVSSPPGPRRPTAALAAATLAVLLTVTATACAGGPAANRAAALGGSSDPTESAGPGDPGDPVDPTGSGTPGPDPTGTTNPDDPSASPGDTPTEPDPPPAEGEATTERTYPLEGISDPWGLTLLPDGDALVGSRDTGTIYRVAADDGEIAEVGQVPGVDASDGGGLLGLATEGEFIYAYYSTSSDFRVSRFRMRSEDEVERTPAHLVSRIPDGLTSDGGAIGFGPDDMVYAAVGDGVGDDPDLTRTLLRMAPDGDVPEGNPTDGSLAYITADAAVTGFAWDELRRLWTVESDGSLYVDGKLVPAWSATKPGSMVYLDGSLWLPEVGTDALWRVPLNRTELVATPEALPLEHGPLRTLVSASDGLWVLTEDELLRVSVT